MSEASRAPLLLFAPGAGLPSSAPWMTHWASRLATLGRVARFDYPYQLAKKKRPDPQPVLERAHREALAKERRDGEPVVLVGKSMGSRIGCHVSLTERVAALVCFGFPLVSQSGKSREDVLLALETPVLFIQGTRDSLCPLAALENVRARMRCENVLHVLESGDHSLLVTKSSGIPQERADADVLAAIATFLQTRCA